MEQRNTNIIDFVKRKLKYVDKTYWAVFIFLVVFAVLELFSASSTLAFKTGSLLWTGVASGAVHTGGSVHRFCGAALSV